MDENLGSLPQGPVPEPGRSEVHLPALELLREHEAEQVGAPGRRVVDLILTKLDTQFRMMVAKYAASNNVGCDDLYQAASAHILKQTKVNPDDDRLLGWLSRTVRSVATDLIKSESRQPVPMSVEDLPEHPAGSLFDRLGEAEWFESMFDGALTDDQVVVFRVLVREPDVSMRAVAEMVGQSYQCVRQIRSRGAARLRDRMGLTEEERAVYVRCRRGERVAAVAGKLGMDEPTAPAVFRSADAKVRAFLNGEC